MSDASPYLTCYKPSGTFPIGGVILTLAGSAVFGVVLGAVYGFANYHAPLVLIKVPLAAGFGFALGWAVSFGVRVFHIRSAFAAGVVGLAVFAAAYVSHFVFYLAVAFADDAWNVGEIFGVASLIFSSPDDARGILNAVREEGARSLFGGGGRGVAVLWIFLIAAWVGEALVIAFGAITCPVGRARSPYSERRGAWLEPVKLPKWINYIENFAALATAVSGGNYSALTTPWLDEPWKDSERFDDLVKTKRLAGADAHPELDAALRLIVEDVCRHHAAKSYAKATLYADASEAYISLTNVTVAFKKQKKNTKSVIVVKYWKIPANAALDIKSALS